MPGKARATPRLGIGTASVAMNQQPPEAGWHQQCDYRVLNDWPILKPEQILQGVSRAPINTPLAMALRA